MKIHVAFLKREVIEAFLSGRKHYECRLSKRPSPVALVSRGDRVLLKQSGGEILAAAMVVDKHLFSGLCPEDIDALYELVGSPGKFEAGYWHSKKDARHAVILELSDIATVSFPEEFTPRGVQSAWVSNFEFGHLAVHQTP